MHVIKSKIIPFILTAIILISCLFIPASAYNNGYYSFDDNHFYMVYESGTYVFNNYSFNITTDGTVCVCSFTQNNLYNYIFTTTYGTEMTIQSNLSLTFTYEETVDGEKYPFITSYGLNLEDIDPNLTIFPINTSSERYYMFSSIANALNSEPISSKSLNYSLPAGNAIFIEYYGNCNYTIQTASDSPGGMNPSNVNGIKSGYSTSVESFNYNSSYLNYTSFSGYGNSTVLGQYVTYTSNGNTAIESPSGAKYLVIVNPMFNQLNDTGKTNPHINITASSISKFYIIPMNTQLNNGEWTSSGNDNSIIYGEYDEDTQEWYTTDSNGDPTNPVNGGLTISGEPKTITEWLETIVNTLTDFFKGPVNAINILIQNLSGFVNSLKSLYMWLPSPVYSLLTSAIMVAITIGVIKIFI